VHFTNLVVHAGVKQDTFGCGGLAGVNVSRNTDIAITLDGGGASHDGPLGNSNSKMKTRHAVYAA
jgi:hypothetical protein